MGLNIGVSFGLRLSPIEGLLRRDLHEDCEGTDRDGTTDEAHDEGFPDTPDAGLLFHVQTPVIVMDSGGTLRLPTIPGTLTLNHPSPYRAITMPMSWMLP